VGEKLADSKQIWALAGKTIWAEKEPQEAGTLLKAGSFRKKTGQVGIGRGEGTLKTRCKNSPI